MNTRSRKLSKRVGDVTFCVREKEEVKSRSILAVCERREGNDVFHVSSGILKSPKTTDGLLEEDR